MLEAHVSQLTIASEVCDNEAQKARTSCSAELHEAHADLNLKVKALEHDLDQALYQVSSEAPSIPCFSPMDNAECQRILKNEGD